MRYVLFKYDKKEDRDFLTAIKYKAFKVYKQSKINLLDTEGIIVTLPFLETDLLERYEYCIKCSEELLDRILLKENVSYAFPRELYCVGGKKGYHLSSVIAGLRFKNFVEAYGKSLKYDKVVILGSDTRLIKTVLELIYKSINRLFIYSPPDSELLKISQSIYSETGLDIIFISNLKSPLFTDCDIIINTGVNLGEVFNFIKKDSLYITIEGEDVFLDQRGDIDSISLNRLTYNNEKYDSAYLEAVLCARDYSFRNWANSRYNKNKLYRIIKTVEELNLWYI